MPTGITQNVLIELFLVIYSWRQEIHGSASENCPHRLLIALNVVESILMMSETFQREVLTELSNIVPICTLEKRELVDIYIQALS